MPEKARWLGRQNPARFDRQRTRIEPSRDRASFETSLRFGVLGKQATIHKLAANRRRPLRPIQNSARSDCLLAWCCRRTCMGENLGSPHEKGSDTKRHGASKHLYFQRNAPFGRLVPSKVFHGRRRFKKKRAGRQPGLEKLCRTLFTAIWI